MIPPAHLSATFAERLRAGRTSRKLSQSEVAELASMRASAISRFETNNGKPSLGNLCRLADALAVTTDYLLGRTDVISGSAASLDRLHSLYSGLSAEYQELADDFIEVLAHKAGRGSERP